MSSLHTKQLTPEDYKKAERFAVWHVFGYLKNLDVRPHWLGNTDLFHYRRQTKTGVEFVIIDAATGMRKPAFDHKKLADVISKLTKEKVSEENLPIANLQISEDINSIKFDLAGKRYEYDPVTGSCTKSLEYQPLPDELLSPDKKHVAFVQDNNFFVKQIKTSEVKQLTYNGEPHYAYAKSPDANLITITAKREGRKSLPKAIWSPDSKKILTYKLDERKVKSFPLVQNVPENGNSRPKLFTVRMAIAGDEHLTVAEHLVIDIENGQQTWFDTEPMLATNTSPIEQDLIWWSKDGLSIYSIQRERAEKALHFKTTDVKTGKTKEILEERAETYVEAGAQYCNRSMAVIENSQEFIWFSEQDGWGHFYLHDLNTGELKNQITSGEWVVRDIHHIDETSRVLYFTAGGHETERDPYCKHMYKINLDGTGLKLLTPEDAEHTILREQNPLSVSISPFSPEPSDVGFSPSGKYFIDTHSRVDKAPMTAVRDTSGEQICVLEKADVSQLIETGWQWPEPIKTKGRDGKTDIFGMLYLPTDFDENKKYPILDWTYPGPHAIFTPKSSFGTDLADLGYFMLGSVLAELGIAVVILDGMGTPFRSKAFQDVAYKNMKDAGIPDPHCRYSKAGRRKALS